MPRMKSLILLVVFGFAVAVGACNGDKKDKKKSEKKGTDDMAAKAMAPKDIDKLSEAELFAKAYGVFPRLAASAKKHGGNCDKIADEWRGEFMVLGTFVDKVKKIEASDPAKKKMYQQKYRKGLMAFVMALSKLQKTCKDNEKFKAVLKLMR